MSAVDPSPAPSNATSSTKLQDSKSMTVDTYGLGEGLEAQPSSHTSTYSVPTVEPQEDGAFNDDVDKSDEKEYVPKEKLRHKIARVRFVCWFALGGAILAIPLVLSATALKAVQIGDVRLLGFFFWLELSWAGVWCSYFVAWCLGQIFYRLCQEKNFACDDYENLVNTLRTPMTLLFWSIVLWSITPTLCSFSYGHCTSGWVSVLKKVLLATLVVAAMFFAKSVLVQLLYAQSTSGFLSFRKRGLEKRGAALATLMIDPDLTNPGYDPNAGTMDWLQREVYLVCSETVSKLKELAKFCFSPDVFKHPIKNPHDMQVFLSQFFSEGSSSEQDYEKLRDWIFYRMLQYPSSGEKPPDKLTETQIARRLQRHRDNEVFPAINSRIKSLKDLMKILDPNGDKEVDRDEVEWLAREVGQGLVEVKRGQKDIRKVLNNLDRVLSLLVLIGIGLVYAAFFIKHFSNYLTPLWTTFTGISFALAGSVQEFIASCAFVFAKHPFDVGDRVTLKERELIVEEILLTHTVFRRVDNGKVTHIPHSEASTECIENLSRTNGLVEKSALQVPPAITHAIVSEVEKELVKSMKASRNPPISRYLTITLRLTGGIVPGFTAEQMAAQRSLEVNIKHEDGSFCASADVLENCRETTMKKLQKLLDDICSCSNVGLDATSPSVEDPAQTEPSVPVTVPPLQTPETGNQDAISSAVETVQRLSRRLNQSPSHGSEERS